MSLIQCEHCGKPFFAHHKRCIHCRSQREDVTATPPLKKPVSVLLSMVAGATLLMLWGLAAQPPLQAAEKPQASTVTTQQQP